MYLSQFLSLKLASYTGQLLTSKSALENSEWSFAPIIRSLWPTTRVADIQYPAKLALKKITAEREPISVNPSYASEARRPFWS